MDASKENEDNVRFLFTFSKIITKIWSTVLQEKFGATALPYHELLSYSNSYIFV